MARGSVRRAADGTWYVRYDAGVRPDGRRDQRYRGGFDSAQAADAFLVRALYDVAEGRHTRHTRQTFGAYAEEWLTLLTVRATTQDAYASNVAALVPLLGAVPLASLATRHLKRASADLHARYAPGTAARCVRTLRSICRAAVREGLLAGAVLEALPSARSQPREYRILELDELAGLLAALDVDRQAVLWQTYARTGLRRGEALGLCWTDVDLARRRLSVRRQVTQPRHARPTLTPPKTARSARTIALDAALCAILTAHRERQRTAYLAAGVGRPRPDLLFCDRPGVPLRPVGISKRFHLLATHAELPELRLHDLRHTRATHLLRAGTNPRLVADYLGHDVALLLRTYAHALEGDQDAAVARVADALDATRHEDRTQRGTST